MYYCYNSTKEVQGKKYIGVGCLVCLCKSLEGDGGLMFFDAEMFIV